MEYSCCDPPKGASTIRESVDPKQEWFARVVHSTATPSAEEAVLMKEHADLLRESGSKMRLVDEIRIGPKTTEAGPGAHPRNVDLTLCLTGGSYVVCRTGPHELMVARPSGLPFFVDAAATRISLSTDLVLADGIHKNVFLSSRLWIHKCLGGDAAIGFIEVKRWSQLNVPSKTLPRGASDVAADCLAPNVIISARETTLRVSKPLDVNTCVINAQALSVIKMEKLVAATLFVNATLGGKVMCRDGNVDIAHYDVTGDAETHLPLIGSYISGVVSSGGAVVVEGLSSDASKKRLKMSAETAGFQPLAQADYLLLPTAE